jgi:hypothetical protein
MESRPARAGEVLCVGQAGRPDGSPRPVGNSTPRAHGQDAPLLERNRTICSAPPHKARKVVSAASPAGVVSGGGVLADRVLMLRMLHTRHSQRSAFIAAAEGYTLSYVFPLSP